MTELEGNCSLSSYSSASRILHVTSSSAAGPFTVQDVALEAFAHNPQVVRDVDGAYLLYHIGNPLPAYCAGTSCKGGAPSHANASCSGASHGTSVARATSLSGPWERLSYILPDNETNPSVLILPNGTIVVTARRWTVGVPTYVAASWRGPYVEQPRAPVYLINGPTSVFPNGNLSDPFDEDAFLFQNELGFHMLTHRQPAGTNCPPTGNDGHDCRCAGGHMYTTDLLQGPWFADGDLVYNCTLNVAGSPSPLELHARQRPTILFPPKSGGGEPSCPILFTGASDDAVSQYYSSFTMAQGVSC